MKGIHTSMLQHPALLSKRLLLVAFFFCIHLSSCKKVDSNAPKTPGSKSPGKFFITAIVGVEKDLGLIVNDPISGLEYAAFGHKKSNGKLDSVKFIIQTDPATGVWLAHEFDEEHTIKNTTTSTGQTIEYSNIDFPAKTATVKVTETATKTVIWSKNNHKLNDDFFELTKRGREAGKKNSKGFKTADQGEFLYLVTSAAGCGMGIIGLSVGGPIGFAWGVYNIYQNCKSAYEAVKNLTNGQPAFGCIATMDNANALSGFAETISQGGGFATLASGLIPALINYSAQQAGAGQCDDQPDEDDGNLGGTGSGWGDPHLNTMDGLFYDFHGYGEFVAVKSTVDNFEVQVRQEQLSFITAQVTVNRGLAVQTGTDVVCVVAGPQRLFINNVNTQINFTTLPLQDGASITKSTDKSFPILIIKSKNGDLVKVRLDQSFNGSFIDYSVQLKENRKGKVRGLLGNYDGDKENDLQLPNGTKVERTFSALYPAYADSWRIESTHSLFYYEGGKTTGSHTQKDFPKTPVELTEEKRKWAENVCRNGGVNDEPFLSNCITDVALTNDPALVAAALWRAQMESGTNLPAMDMSAIELQGEAKQLGNCIRLTEAAVFQSGQAFHKAPISGDFETAFSFKISYSKNGGADGFALLIAKDIPALKSNAYPGMDGRLGYEGVKASLAVEFDTYPNAGENGNHVAIHTNGKDANSTAYNFRIAYNDKIISIKDGELHTVKVSYKNKTITVLLDGATVLETAVDLVETLGLQSNFFVGLTASTNGSFEAHDICGWVVKD